MHNIAARPGGFAYRNPPYGASATLVARTEPSTCFGPVTLTLARFAVATAHVVDV